MALLKRITDANGDAIYEITDELLNLMSNPPELRKFIDDVYEKFMIEFGNSGYVAQILQLDQSPKFMLYYTNAVKQEIDLDLNSVTANAQLVREELEDFIKLFDFFYCTFLITPDLSHAFFVKKLPGGRFQILDPNGKGITLTQVNIDNLKTIFRIPDGQEFEFSQCQLQTDLPNCMLWTMLLVAHREKTTEEISKMLENTAAAHGYDPEQRGSYDIIITAIFNRFLEEGFATDEHVAQYPEEDYLKGLGKRKCRKCGLPK